MLVVVFRMNMRKFVLGLVAAAWLTSTPAQAWWSGGHQSVGLVALHQLRPKTRARLEAIVACHPDGGGYASQFSKACVWPDNIHKKPGDHPTWHYRDKAFFDGVPEHEIPHDDQDALDGLAWSREMLANSAISQADRAVAISWLGHLVADVHQPMHATTRCDKVHPDGDRGGNLFPLSVEGIEHANLHKFWDSVALELNPEPSPEKLDAFVARLEMRYPRTFFLGKADDTDPNHWLEESFQVAVQHAYPNIHPSQAPSAEYVTRSQALCEQRIALAGYRLADQLEEFLGSTP